MQGWEIIDSNGNPYKSWASAVDAFLADPTLRFGEESFSMAGYEVRDVTREVAARAAKRPAQ